MTNINTPEKVDVEKLIACFCGAGGCDNFNDEPDCPSTQGDIMARQHHAIERGICPRVLVNGETGVMTSNKDGSGSFVADRK